MSPEEGPTWGEYVDATIRAHVIGYELGYAHARRDVDQEAAAARAWQGASAVIRNVVADPSRTWAPDGQPQRKGVA